MDSMLDLEQLRLSVNEQDISSSIYQVQQWIATHGLNLLRTNQRLPFNYEEAEEIRKQHEKIELKCMTFLAFYAKINLKNIPEEYEDMREDMDITIHKFSDHIKARRHVVVSFFTFFRHLEKLQEKLSNLQNEDISDLPDSIKDINNLIAKFHKNTNNCLKILSHLKVEADRVKSSMDLVVTINNSPLFEYIDRALIIEAKMNIDKLLHEMEIEVTRVFESQRLLELELKIEAKMMQIEDDTDSCCGWLQKMEQKLVDIYNGKVVGMATVENDVLLKQVDDLVNKMKLTKEYGGKLMHMYKKLCLQFKRDTSRGQISGEKLEDLWKIAEFVSKEALSRLQIAGKLYHGLDSTLDKVEDMLLSINKDRENSATDKDILENYQGVRNEAQKEFRILKQSANELFKKLRFNLFNEKLKPSDGGFLEAEQTQDMVKMKIFTIAVKLKELDRCIFQDDVPIIIRNKEKENNFEKVQEDVPVIVGKNLTQMNTEPVPLIEDVVDSDNQGNIHRFLNFLRTTKLNWESKPLPKNLDQAVKALKEHQNISNHSDNYWKNIQNNFGSIRFQSKGEKESFEKLLSDASREKNNWDNNWKSHLEDKLNPRYQLLTNIQDFNYNLDDNLNTLDDLVNRPNHTLLLTKGLKDELLKMRFQIPNKEQTLEKLYRDANYIDKTDFNDQLSKTEDKMNDYRDRLDNFLEMEGMIEKILEFLPHLSQFKKEWEDKVVLYKDNYEELNNLKYESEEIKRQIAKFDIAKLRNLASVTYGSSKRVEWLIDELKADFYVPVASQVKEEYITPTHHARKQMAYIDVIDSPQTKPKKESSINVMLNSPTELQFEIADLPKVDQDQYNIQWYKNNRIIDPSKDFRITTAIEPRTGQLNMKIEKCEFADAGKYWCEVENLSSGLHTSYPVNLTVISKNSPPVGSVDALFGERVFAGRNNPLTLELKLDGYRFAPECDLRHDSTPVSVNQRDCPWTRISSNTDIEFCHPSITDSDRGKYEFIIANKVVAKTQIIIGEAPKLLHHHFNEKVKVGDAIIITIPTVNIIDKGDQKVLWKKDDTHLSPDDGKFSWNLNEDGDPVFEIEKAKLVHAGIYTCEVFNQYGRTSAQVILDVINTGKEGFDQNNLNNDESVVNKLTVISGESVILDIDCIPSNNTDINWTKDGKPIGIGDSRMKIYNVGNSHSKLQINNAELGDSGLYIATVKGTNRSKSTILEIISITKKPVIVKYPQIIKVKLNEPLNIECLVESIPPCKDVKWTIRPSDGSPLKNITNNVRCKLTTSIVGDGSDNLQTLKCHIDHAGRADLGEYGLRCENDVGWTSVKIPVSIAEDVENKKKPPTFIISLKREMTSRGDEPVLLKCKVAGNPFPTVKWIKDGHEVKSSEFIKIHHMGDVHDLTILNTTADDCGTYEVIASNSLGLESCQCLLKVVSFQEIPESENVVPKNIAANNTTPDDVSDLDPIPQRTQLIFANTVVRSPPQFLTTFTDEIVQEGDEVALKCCLVGQPEPVVWWSYNTHLLKNPRFEVIRQSDEYGLLMHDVKEQDSGRYSMTAENSSGLATCSALVIVEKNHERGKSLDRSQYRTSSKPRNPDSKEGSFPCHTTLSNTMNPSLPDGSRTMEVSPRGWDVPPNSHTKTIKIEVKSSDNIDISKTKTKTVKTYRYSGPSATELPGIGIIPKFNIFSPESSLSSNDHVNRSAFVSGQDRKSNGSKPPAPAAYTRNMYRDSVAESSDCDYPL